MSEDIKPTNSALKLVHFGEVTFENGEKAKALIIRDEGEEKIDDLLDIIKEKSPKAYKRILHTVGIYAKKKLKKSENKLVLLRLNDVYTQFFNSLTDTLIKAINAKTPKIKRISREKFLDNFYVHPLTKDGNEIADKIEKYAPKVDSNDPRKTTILPETRVYLNKVLGIDAGGRYKSFPSTAVKLIMKTKIFTGETEIGDYLAGNYVGRNESVNHQLVDVFQFIKKNEKNKKIFKKSWNIRDIEIDKLDKRGLNQYNINFISEYRDILNKTKHKTGAESQVIMTMEDYMVDRRITHKLYKGENLFGIIPTKDNDENDFHIFETDNGDKIKLPYRDLLIETISKYAKGYKKHWATIEFVNNFPEIELRADRRATLAHIWWEGRINDRSQEEIRMDLEKYAREKEVDEEVLNKILETKDLTKFDFIKDIFADVTPKRAREISEEASPSKPERVNLLDNIKDLDAKSSKTKKQNTKKSQQKYMGYRR